MQLGNPRRKLVLLALLMHADEHGRAWPAQATLAQYAECSERTVYEHLRALEAEGYLMRLPQPRDARERFKTNVYRLRQNPGLPTVDRQNPGLPTEGDSPSEVSAQPSEAWTSDGPSEVSSAPSEAWTSGEGQEEKTSQEGHFSKASRSRPVAWCRTGSVGT